VIVYNLSLDKELQILWSPYIIARDISKSLNEHYFVFCGMVVFKILDYCGTATVSSNILNPLLNLGTTYLI
jgi:hypothetical protein